MISVTINWQKKFGLSHRTVICITILPNWFCRNILFVRIKQIYFEGSGMHWKRIRVNRFRTYQQYKAEANTKTPNA